MNVSIGRRAKATQSRGNKALMATQILSSSFNGRAVINRTNFFVSSFASCFLSRSLSLIRPFVSNYTIKSSFAVIYVPSTSLTSIFLPFIDKIKYRTFVRRGVRAAHARVSRDRFVSIGVSRIGLRKSLSVFKNKYVERQSVSPPHHRP